MSTITDPLVSVQKLISKGNASPITPPDSPSSHSPLQQQELFSEDPSVSISTTFFPGAQLNQPPSDLILVSADSVFFYVHSTVLLSLTQNNFNRLLPISISVTSSSDSGNSNSSVSVSSHKSPLSPQDLSISSSITHDPSIALPTELITDPPVLLLDEPSEVLNVILHALYGLSCAHYSPILPILTAALSSMVHVYGVPLQSLLTPSHPLFITLLSHAPASPLEIYTLASTYALEQLAVACSPHLLSFPLHSLTDAAAAGIDGAYLKRLFFMHVGRCEALKEMLLPPPNPHTPTAECNVAEQNKLTRAWAWVAAYLAWDARPDTPVSTLESAFSPLGEKLWCNQCKEALRKRQKELIVQWSIVKRTI